MTTSGQVNLVNDTTTFYAPLALGIGTPEAGYQPSSGYAFEATLTGIAEFFPGLAIPVPLITTASTTNGQFEFPDFPPSFAVQDAWLTLRLGGYQYYRSELFRVDNARDGLNIYLYEPRLPASDGISAGTVSGVLGSHGLPGDTSLTANAWGFNVAGSESQVNLQFGIAITPDVSPNLDVYFDLALNGYNIHVGWPEDWCESADDVLNSIKSGLQSAGSGANKAVAATMTSIMEGQPLNLTSTETANLLTQLSIQFVTVTFPNEHTWALSDTTDTTIVIFAQPTLGYPRGW